jgi:ribonucleoside-diphosphate reductase alpha chain
MSVKFVVKREGNTVAFDSSKIVDAVYKAFKSVPLNNNDEMCYNWSRKVSIGVYNSLIENVVSVEVIHDLVEEQLMELGFFKTAKSYILYREKRTQKREQDNLLIWINSFLSAIQKDFDLSFDDIRLSVIQNKTKDCSKEQLLDLAILSARTLVEVEPDYRFVAARLLLEKVKTEVRDFDYSYQGFVDYFLFGMNHQISLELKEFDWVKLYSAIKPERDYQFDYLGLQTLYDRYLLRNKTEVYELPQFMFMRVAMGLAINEGEQKNERAIKFYNSMSSFDYMPSTPTLFNAGTTHPQLSSCYLTTVPDDLEGIYESLKDNALLSKYAGGLGNDWTNVRALGAHIKGTNGESQGVVPFLKVADSTAVAVNQGGKRKGATCAYLEVWHMDIEEFLELRKNTGDDRRRTHDMNTALWVCDLFMQRVENDLGWLLFSPNDTPDLHDLYGREFELRYEHYEHEALNNKIKYKSIKAVDLWRKMLTMLFETGHPWITFKDRCNERNPQKHCGVIHSSNLCTEITLNTSEDEIAVCNLGSINLVNHVKNGEVDCPKLADTVETAVRMLDNVIDINFYPVEKARNSNLKHRPIGLGIMGFQDLLYEMDLSYESKKAEKLAYDIMEHISFNAIKSSVKLARERGSYPSYKGSDWSKGIVPIETSETSVYINSDSSWNTLKEFIVKDGMRNSNLMAIAPTATISNICGVSQSIEPTYQNLYVKSNLSGQFVEINKYLVDDLKELGFWNEITRQQLKNHNGSIQALDIPHGKHLKDKYKTAFEVDPYALLNCAAARQVWIDQAQSFNVYMAKPNGKALSDYYMACWKAGLKTTYYLRSLGAKAAGKAAGKAEEVKVCSIDNPDCEACQ